METEIPKVYSPENIEPRWARFWVAQNLYRPADDERPPAFLPGDSPAEYHRDRSTWDTCWSTRKSTS